MNFYALEEGIGTELGFTHSFDSKKERDKWIEAPPDHTIIEPKPGDELGYPPFAVKCSCCGEYHGGHTAWRKKITAVEKRSLYRELPTIKHYKNPPF